MRIIQLFSHFSLLSEKFLIFRGRISYICTSFSLFVLNHYSSCVYKRSSKICEIFGLWKVSGRVPYTIKKTYPPYYYYYLTAKISSKGREGNDQRKINQWIGSQKI